MSRRGFSESGLQRGALVWAWFDRLTTNGTYIDGRQDTQDELQAPYPAHPVRDAVAFCKMLAG